MYEMTRQIYCSNIGEDCRLRNSAIIDILQDASNFHLDTHPVMGPFFEKEHCVMYLVSRQTDIFRRPEYGEKIRVKTWTYEIKRMYGYRNTVIFGEDGKPCIAAIASGAFMDTDTQRPMRISQELVDRIPVYPCYDMEYTSRKITLPDVEPDKCEPIAVRKCDIDMNRHVNNARYIDITDELLPDGAEVKRMRIEYKVPLKRGETVVPVVYRSGNIFTVSLNSLTDKPYCIVEYTLDRNMV